MQVSCQCFPGRTVLRSDPSHCGRQSTNCSAMEFECSSGDCIPFHFTCDGVAECPDFSDELPTYCMFRKCLPGFFQCQNSRYKILHIVFKIERVRNPFSRFFLDVCCKTLPAMDKTTAGISVTKPIALAALVNSDALPAIVYQTVLDATLIPIVQMLQMKWVARNPTAP